MKRNLRTLIGIAAVALFVIGVINYLRRKPEVERPPGVIVKPGPIPELPNKPPPVTAEFKGCPPEGDGGDPALNRLKNRVDEGNYVPVAIDAILQLTWPQTVERRNRAKWSASDTAAVSRYEGTPVAAEGYLAQVKEEGPESCNCHGADHEFHDFHIWLTQSAGEDRTRSVVIEANPHGRDQHPAWAAARLREIVRNQQRVRISGWLLLDPEHPDQVGKTRGTIWEIHPITQIAAQQQGRWVTLDK